MKFQNSGSESYIFGVEESDFESPGAQKCQNRQRNKKLRLELHKTQFSIQMDSF